MTKPADDSLIPRLAGDAVGALPGGGLASAFTERAVGLLLRESQQNRSRMIRMACQKAALSREDLEERLAEEPRLIPLTIRTLHAAGMTGQDETLRLLAGFLGDALADVATVSDVETIIGVVQNLTEHHIKVLEIVASSPSEYPQLGSSIDHWTSGLVVSLSSMRSELALIGIQGLIATGFLSDAGIDGGGVTWDDLGKGGAILEVTELGKTVLRMLGDVAEADRGH